MLRPSFDSTVAVEYTVGGPGVQKTTTVRSAGPAVWLAVPGRDVVYVVAKAPRPGHSKTRLCPPLLPDQAARLAAAFLEDTIALAVGAGVDVRLICRDEGEREALLPFAAGRASVHVQDGIGLGAALESAFVGGLGDGYRGVGVLGMDSPTLPRTVIVRAFAHLHRGADVVLGPSVDGGYYLLAARRTYPSLFRDMAWSTSAVARETLARCAALGLRARMVERWRDVDDDAGLRALRRQVETAGPRVAPATRTVLAELDITLDGERAAPWRAGPRGGDQRDPRAHAVAQAAGDPGEPRGARANGYRNLSHVRAAH